jgi:hypothetical protein
MYVMLMKKGINNRRRHFILTVSKVGEVWGKI